MIGSSPHSQARLGLPSIEQLGLWLERSAAAQAQGQKPTGTGDARAGADRHALAVGSIAARVACALGFAAADMALIEQAARGHDIGKRRIELALLDKPSALMPEETKRLRHHVHWGGLLKSQGQDLGCADVRADVCVALLHHERWDGNGYPFGLAGAETPLAACIAAVADVYDALVNQRPYKRAWSHDEAVSFIEARAGSQFDPGCVQALLRAFKHGRDSSA